MEAFVNYIFRIPKMVFLLSLTALACLPIALGSLVRDAGISLLLSLSLMGTLLAIGLAKWQVRKFSAGMIIVFLGPLALFVYTGQLGRPIYELVRQTFIFAVGLVNWLYERAPFDPSSFVLATSDLTQRFFAVGSRLLLWVAGLWQGVFVEDPLIRAFIWGLLIWLIAAWAGWQIFGNDRVLVGMVPTTLALALVLDYTGKEFWILWLHISLLVFLYGLSGFATLRKRWEISRVDYSDSTLMETLLTVGALTCALIVVAFFASSISLKDILDDLRERRASSSEERTDSLGLQPGGGGDDGPAGPSADRGFPQSHMIGPGPDLSDRLVMIVSIDDMRAESPGSHPVTSNYYWRTMTYEHYAGVGWTNPTPFAQDVSAAQTLIEPPDENYRLVRQVITFVDGVSANIYWTGTLVSADVPFQALWIRKAVENPLLESDMLAALAPVESYTADSLVLNVSADELRTSPAVYPDWVRKRFLGLPDSVPDRVLALGRDISASGKTPYDRALAIQNYLRQFPYSLDVTGPPPGRDAVDFFLFDLKQGYCDYYATAMAVLARAAGLPARIVMGYTSGAYDEEQARYLVTEKNAHAWVEIYFTDIGWVEFEPTASQPVIEYSEIASSPLPIQPMEPQTSSSEAQTTLLSRVLDLAWMAGIAILALALIWIAWDSARLPRLEPSRSMQLLYRRMRRIARPVSGSVFPDQTAHEYASLLTARMASLQAHSHLQSWLSPARDEITQLTELYERSLFASASPTCAEARYAIKIWPRLQLRLICADAIAVVNHLLHRILKKPA